MGDLLFNLRIWCIHFQIWKNFKIVPMFAWYDFWMGIFVDTKKDCWYIFIFPTLGIKLEGIAIKRNTKYNWKKDPFIFLFTWRGKSRYEKYRNE